MKSPFRNIYVTNRLFLILGAIATLFAIGFAIPPLFMVAQILLVAFGATILTDLILLFNPSTKISCKRNFARVFSLSDENKVHLNLHNKSGIPLQIKIIDELPYQFQNRHFLIQLSIEPGDQKQIEYTLRPVLRGEYYFNNINIFATSIIGLVTRRFVIADKMLAEVYPSIIQMKQYELRTLARISFFDGVKKLRRIGHSYEFDQIKKYVQGDDIRSINWKATGRVGELMVNHYQEERSQQVFCIIDKSRTMKMPFHNLSLLDYAINTTLTISNIALKKEDRIGLITFSDRIGTTIAPNKHTIQLQNVLDALYKEKERFTEANYELLYLHIRNFIRVRSLLFLFTNFESLYAIERAVTILRKLNKLHLLVVIFFENEEISSYSKTDVESLEDVYLTTIAHKFSVEKNIILQELKKYGIQTIISTPEELSINTINKYLELKAKGLV